MVIKFEIQSECKSLKHKLSMSKERRKLMKKNKSKNIETILPVVGKCLGVVLVISLFSAGYSAENNNSTT